MAMHPDRNIKSPEGIAGCVGISTQDSGQLEMGREEAAPVQVSVLLIQDLGSIGIGKEATVCQDLCSMAACCRGLSRLLPRTLQPPSSCTQG